MIGTISLAEVLFAKLASIILRWSKLSYVIEELWKETKFRSSCKMDALKISYRDA